MPDALHVLIVDDEPNIRSGLAKGLAKEAEFIEIAANAEQALEIFEAGTFQIVIADVRLPGEFNGLQLVSEIKKRAPDTVAIVITAHGTVETAVEAMRRGAFDFITKPVDLNLIRQQIRKAYDYYELQTENRHLKDRLADVGEVSGIIGQCAAMRDVFRQVQQVAETDATVLIEGESGTGKELIARALHDLSGRRAGPFIAVNLGALPETLLESELFGHEKGSFSGATRQKPGCFEQSLGGTLFLDEVTEMSAKSQIDILRVLETGEFCRVGGESMLRSDARIVSATNKEMRALIDDGSFREDLYYRLNVVPIHVPPLRDRRDDIVLLSEHFLKHFCERHQRETKRLSDEAYEILMGAKWPGNVRQLRNVMERLVVTVSDDVIEAKSLPLELQAKGPSNATTQLLTLAEATEKAEKKVITQALEKCDFHREKTAKLLGVSVRTLHYKMNRYGLH